MLTFNFIFSKWLGGRSLRSEQLVQRFWIQAELSEFPLYAL